MMVRWPPTVDRWSLAAGRWSPTPGRWPLAADRRPPTVGPRRRRAGTARWA
ncbi:hypothetical protein [Streptomyces sp. NPDC127039]|uniref:hypothetical protein n=1 Tax=Streptomyces sp. NPDC127039 TaxID=3347115 RepID=UPI0036532B28